MALRTPLLSLALLCLWACGESGVSKTRGAGLAQCVEELSLPLILCPRAGKFVHGIDVSRWQGTVRWQEVFDDGVTFAFARVSDGTANPDTAFATNWRQMKAAGVVRGAYQFFRPTVDPIAQAKLLLTALDEGGGLAPDDLPPVLDLEAADGVSADAYRLRARAWIEHVEAALDRRVIVYTGSRFADVVGDAFADRELWVPNYKAMLEGSCPKANDAWNRWAFWQWTNEGKVRGIVGNVDRNVFDGTFMDLVDFIARSHVAPDAGGLLPHEGDAGVPYEADAAVLNGTDASPMVDGQEGSDAPDAGDGPGTPVPSEDDRPEFGGAMGEAGREDQKHDAPSCSSPR